MYQYDPSSIMNPQLQLNNYLNESRDEVARGYRRAIPGNNGASIALGALAGALTAKLIFDLFDR